MTVPGPATVTVRKPKWTQRLPEIPATRFSCITSGSLRPKLGLCILTTVFILAVCFVLVPLVNSPKMAAITHKESVLAVAKANQDFTSKLFSQLIKSLDKEDNLVASPFSISSVMAMAVAGARGGTADQMKSALTFPEDKVLQEGYEDLFNVLKSGENFTLDAANQVYSQSGYTLLDAFVETLKSHYHTVPQQLDFAKSEEARGTINDWVQKTTHDKIKDLLPSGSIDQMTRLVLVNAIYFKGDWALKFDPQATTTETFNVSPEKKVEVQMMHKKGVEYRGSFIKELSTDVLELPYKGERLSMLLFLPHKPEGFEALEAKFASDIDIVGLELSGRKAKYDVSLPRFKLESSLDLGDHLKAIGMTDAFSDSADFSGITGNKDLRVSKAVQKAFIEVNEEGSEAAAATGMVMMTRMMVINKKFICDRPFLFAIKDNLSGMVLFTGRVVNPAA